MGGRTLQALTALRGHQVDGLIVTPPESTAINGCLVAAARQGTPIVLIGMRLDPPVTDRVTTDTYAGARQAMEHLIALGHRRIGYVGGRNLAKGRRRGYTETLKSVRTKVSRELVVLRPLNRTGGVSALEALLALPEPPTAVFAANDAVALGVIQATYKRGLRVPEDLSVVGFDDIDLAEHAVPPLTTVAQPKQRLGHEAMTLVHQRISGTGPARIVDRVLPCELVVRESTAPI